MISLAVKDLQAAVRFYQDGLGLPKMDSPPSVAFFHLNGCWLGLSERESLAGDAGISSAGSGYEGFSLSHNVANESEVDTILNEAIAGGATLVKPAKKADWGGYHGYFMDPDGHLWEIAYNPFVWIGPADE
jgi:catechol 2,3-dioxygenase-like lactoylglutathione lyase family enzyme